MSVFSFHVNHQGTLGSLKRQEASDRLGRTSHFLLVHVLQDTLRFSIVDVVCAFHSRIVHSCIACIELFICRISEINNKKVLT